MSNKAEPRFFERGMSLIEVLVALAILAVAAAVALTLYDVSRKSYKEGENRTEQQQSVRVAFDRMVADLRMTGFNYNPDGDTGRPDEQIEAAYDRAIVIRADFDAEDATLSTVPEASLTGGGMMSVSTGNDEIVAFVLAKDDGSSSDTLTFVADVKDAKRDGGVEAVNIPNVALTHNDPPYTLYRITLNNDTTTWGGTGFVTRTPLIENVYSMEFDYYSIANVDVASPGGLDTVAAKAARKGIARIGLRLIGMTPDPDMEWRDPDDDHPATKAHRKFELTSDIKPRNFGMIGIKDILADVTPPQKPATPNLVPGHCGGLLVGWTANPDSDQVSYYRVMYGTAPNSPSGQQTTEYTGLYLSGLTDATTYYVSIQAIDAAGNVSVPSNEASAGTTNVNTPEAPTNLVGSYDLNGVVKLTWDPVTDNTAAQPAGDPRAPQIRDLAGYRVYRNPHDSSFSNAVLVADENSVGGQGDPTYPDQSVVNCRNYNYWVTAVDTCGLESAASLMGYGNAYSMNAPLAPTALAAFLYGLEDVKLEWDPVKKDVTDSDIYVDTYDVWRSEPVPKGMEPTSDGSYKQVGSVTSEADKIEYVDPSPLVGAPEGYTVYYKVSARDDCYNQSALSESAFPACAFAGDVYFVEPADNQPVAGVVPTTVSVVNGDTEVYVGVTLEFFHQDDGEVKDKVEITDPGPTWTYDWLANPPGPYTIIATVTNTNGCSKTETINVSAGYGVGCCLSPANPEIRPQILTCVGKGNLKCGPVQYDMINNNCLTAVAVEAMEITWVDKTLNDPMLETVFFDTDAIWSPGTSEPLRSPAATDFSDPKPAIPVDRNSANPLVVTYEFNQNMSIKNVGQNTLTTTYKFRLLDKDGLETAITGTCGPSTGMFNDMIVESQSNK